ncbi:hypothetical protein ES705_37260 [subsurface metagenome]
MPLSRANRIPSERADEEVDRWSRQQGKHAVPVAAGVEVASGVDMLCEGSPSDGPNFCAAWSNLLATLSMMFSPDSMASPALSIMENTSTGSGNLGNFGMRAI